MAVDPSRAASHAQRVADFAIKIRSSVECLPSFAMPALTVFSRQSPAPAYDHPRPDRRVSGNPLRTTFEHFLAANGQLSAGIWACEPGAWQIAFAPDKYEFFNVIEGRIRISDAQGQAAEFGPGEACIIPAGFTGTFEVLEAVRKYYFLVEQPA